MATMNISLPDPMRDLIRKDQQRMSKIKTMQDAINLGFESGKAGQLDMKDIKKLARQQESSTE